MRRIKMLDGKLNQPLLGVVAAAVILIALSTSLWSCRNPRGHVELTPYEQVGRVLAQETTRLLNGSGKIAVWQVQLLDNTNPGIPAMGRAFAKALKETPGVTITATEQDVFNPYEPNGLNQTAMEAARFSALLEKYKDVDAVVLIGASPQLTDEDIAQLPNPRPKIIAASLLVMPARRLVEQQVVQVLITNRVRPAAGTAPPDTPAEWFDRRYVLVTAENLEELP